MVEPLSTPPDTVTPNLGPPVLDASFATGTADPIPGPGTLLLLGAGLAGLAVRHRRRDA